ncbi:MAG TPA: hypothetical protein VJT78_01955 [Candidatus Dormibacteraeota bacterium]|nr:hypothetical protein [Candidatus Dormibacteraeota bacterium]
MGFIASRKLRGLFGAAAIAATSMVLGVTNAAASTNATCAGGSVAAGTYQSLTVTGMCQVLSGDVTVTRNITITAGGGLNAAFFGSNLNVGRNVIILPGAVGIVLGCEPFAFPCFNDPNRNTGGTPGMQTNDVVGGNFVSEGAALVLVHHNTIWGEVAQTGGGGGLTCAPLFENGPPPYTTYEDNTIHGDVTVADLHTCWSGIFRNTVSGSVNWNDNVTFDPDGNEVSGNIIAGNLNCFDNKPAAQFGDSAGVPNTVGGATRGQCLNLAGNSVG